MLLCERIKIIRGFFKQEEFATKLGVSKVTVGRWERGERVPDAQDLFKIAMSFPEFNPTWILTGEGEMILRASSDWWSVKIRRILGGMTIPEFVRKVGFEDQKQWIKKIKAIEDGKIDADWQLITTLSQKVGINPDWMIDGGDVPMNKKDKEIVQPVNGINECLMKDAIVEVEKLLQIENIALSPEKKAEIVSLVCKINAGSCYVDKTTIASLIKLAIQ